METDSLPVPTGETMERDSSTDSDLKMRRGIVAKFADGNIKGAVRLLASPDSVVPHNDTTLHQSRCKAPSAPENLALPAAPKADYPFYVTQEEGIKEALASFRPGSASRPDGLFLGHLQTLISSKAIEDGVRSPGSSI